MSLTSELNPQLKQLPGVGPTIRRHLESAGMVNAVDLLSWLPDLYVDPALVESSQNSLIKEGQRLHAVGQVVYARESLATKTQASWFELHLGSGGQTELRCRFDDYDMNALQQTIKMNQWVLVAGPFHQGYVIAPKVIPLGSDYPWPLKKSATTHYPPILGLSDRAMRQIFYKTIHHFGRWLDQLGGRDYWQQKELPPPGRAFFELHLEWPLEEVVKLNQKTTDAHKTIALLQEL